MFCRHSNPVIPPREILYDAVRVYAAGEVSARTTEGGHMLEIDAFKR